MPLAPAIFGISNGTLNTVAELVLLGVVVVWLSLVWFTYADARRRIDDSLLVGSAVLAAIVFPYLGTLIYIIVRPPELLEDIRERELEMQAAEARLHALDYQLCPHCLRKLRDTCGTCTRPLDPDWLLCPYCEAEIPGVTPQRRSRRHSGDDEAPAYDAVGEDPYAIAPPAEIEAGYGDGPDAAYDEALESEAPPSTQL